MSNTNIVCLVGNITRDAELKYSSGGMAILAIGLAVNKSLPPRTDGGEWRQEVSFFDVTAFSKLAENRTYLKKGMKVAVSGELRQERWEHEGQARSKVVVIAEGIECLTPREKGEERAASATPRYPTTPPQAPSSTSPEDFNDDIPFDGGHHGK